MRSMVRWIPSILIMTVLFMLSSVRGEVVNATPAGNAPTQVILHFMFYFSLCLSNYYATGNIFSAVVLTVFYGVFDELHQSFTPLRSPSIFDIKTDAVGALVAATLLKLTSRYRIKA